MDILETRPYKGSDEERVPVIKNWLGKEGLLMIKAFIQNEKDKCKTAKELFLVSR